MARLTFAVLGPLVVMRDGEPVRLTPTNARTLCRLLVAGGKPVTANALYRDLWESGRPATVTRGRMTLVQRQIMELRKALDPDHPGDNSVVLPRDRATGILTYRLVLDRDQVDAWVFGDLVARAQAGPEEAQLLGPALDL